MLTTSAQPFHLFSEERPYMKSIVHSLLLTAFVVSSASIAHAEEPSKMDITLNWAAQSCPDQELPADLLEAAQASMASQTAEKLAEYTGQIEAKIEKDFGGDTREYCGAIAILVQMD